DVRLCYLLRRLCIAKEKLHAVGLPGIGDTGESGPPSLTAGTDVRRRLPCEPFLEMQQCLVTACYVAPAVRAVAGCTECSVQLSAGQCCVSRLGFVERDEPRHLIAIDVYDTIRINCRATPFRTTVQSGKYDASVFRERCERTFKATVPKCSQQ